MSVTHCSRGNDRAFGPVVDRFDFTLFFEDVFLACITSFIFLTLGLIRVSQLIRLPVTTVKPSRVVYTSVSCEPAPVVYLAKRNRRCMTQASVAAQVLQAADACLAVGLSYFEFSLSVRPPIIISLYLLLEVLFDAVRVRSLWLASHSPIAAAPSSLVLGTHAVLLVSESQGKEKYLTTPFSQDTNREGRSGLCGLCLLTWVLPVLQRGLLYQLGLEDIPPVDQKLTAERLIRRLLSPWKQANCHSLSVNQSKKNQLLITLFRTYRTEFFSAVIPRLCFSGFTIMQPLLVSTIIGVVALPDSSETRNKGYGLIAASAIVYVGLAVSTVLYSRQTYRFIIGVRVGLIAVIYRQTLKLRTEDLGTASAITLIGTDVERIATGLRDIHEIYYPGFQVQEQGTAAVELRIHATRQVLNNIKSFKILCLEDRLKVIISGFRSIEIITSRKFRSLIYWEVLISSFPWLAPAASFTLFTTISTVSKEGSLVPSQVLTALSLMTLITMLVWTFIQTLPAIVQCLGSFSRIQDYIALSSSHPSFSQHGTESSPALVPIPPSIDSLFQEKAPVVNIGNTFLRWTPSGQNVFCSINLSMRKGAIIGSMGPVGSGKTMLFESILGETIINQGQILTAPVPVAYCTQTSWLVDASIRRNIVVPLEFQHEWYGRVLWMCGLSDDLQALPEKDSTRVGGQGNTLSGAQKQRVALARAIYSGCELLLLDDIFSGLDPVTISKICRRLLDIHQGYLRRRGITVILSTHNNKLTRAIAEEQDSHPR
ncbi:hypothetical protein V1517DRAFT_266874 [Lipomyces orientalis]|uniref:Uncharacterized protein n=1 Tax=Lipomyces orientalis TaxID=1233043 RepID=A0ACC3TD85_9ASCO